MAYLGRAEPVVPNRQARANLEYLTLYRLSGLSREPKLIGARFDSQTGLMLAQGSSDARSGQYCETKIMSSEHLPTATDRIGTTSATCSPRPRDAITTDVWKVCRHGLAPTHTDRPSEPSCSSRYTMGNSVTRSVSQRRPDDYGAPASG